MATPLKHGMERELKATDHRNTPLVVRFCNEGVYIKTKGQHWDTAALMPWGSIYTQAYIRQSNADKEQKRREKQDKKLGIG